MVDQKEIHDKCLSDDPEERIEALKKLESEIHTMPDIELAWNDFHRLTYDANRRVRNEAVCCFSSTLFHFLPHKQKTWNDLLRLTNDEYKDVRYNAANSLRHAISFVPDGQQMWNDLVKLTSAKDINVRHHASETLRFAFAYVPDKKQACNDLHILTNHEDYCVRYDIADTLEFAFSEIPDKKQVWDDLHRLINDEDSLVRSRAATTLLSVISHIPYKHQIWNNLVKLLFDEDNDVRSNAAYIMSYAFSHVPDKQKAMSALHTLTNDEDRDVRFYIATNFGFAFSEMPDKQQAWNDLHRLTNDEDSLVRFRAAYACGRAFSEIPNKKQACEDLLRLTTDQEGNVRIFANHSLAKASIFQASQARTEEDYKNELEKAIKFFKKASLESAHTQSYFRPSQFCLPFFSSFHAIVFKKQEAEEVGKYLTEARDAIEGSESKALLFNAVENLATALKEVQKMENMDLQVMKNELNFYRKYFNHAEELIRDIEEKAPFATAAMRKGLPILDRDLKEILEEIQKKARKTYTESIGTEVEETAHAVCKEVQKWEIGSQEYLLAQIENLVDLLKSYIPKIKENNLILNKIDTILLESDIVKQYMLLNSLIPQIMDIKISKEMSGLRGSVDKLTASIGELQNPQEYLDIIQMDLKEIKDYMPGMKENIDEVLSQLNSPSNTATQKLEFALPIIPSIVTYKVEADAPKLVDDIKNRFKNLIFKA